MITVPECAETPENLRTLAIGAVADALGRGTDADREPGRWPVGQVRRDADGRIEAGGLDEDGRRLAVLYLSALGLYPGTGDIEDMRSTGGAMITAEAKATCGHHHWEDHWHD